MKHSIALSLFAALLFTTGALATVRAENTASHYNVAIWNAITEDYPVTGTMDITYNDDGTVRGYYHPAGLPSFIPITGGHSGNRVWLTIGINGSWLLDGSVKDDGKITGSATNESSHAPLTPYSFVATPR